MEAILNFDLSVFEFIQNHLGYGTGGFLDHFMPYYTWLGDGAFFIILGVILCIPKKTRKVGFAMLFAQLVMLIANNLILKSIFSRTRPFALFNVDVARQCVEGYTRNGETIVVKHIGGSSYITQVQNEISKYSAEFVQKWRDTYKYYLDVYPYANGFSFPSGHTSSSFAAASGMLYMCKGKKQKAMGWAAMVIALFVGFSRVYLHVHYCTDVLVGMVVGLLCGVAGYFICKALYPYIEKLINLIKVKVFKKSDTPQNGESEAEITDEETLEAKTSELSE